MFRRTEMEIMVLDGYTNITILPGLQGTAKWSNTAIGPWYDPTNPMSIAVGSTIYLYAQVSAEYPDYRLKYWRVQYDGIDYHNETVIWRKNPGWITVQNWMDELELTVNPIFEGPSVNGSLTPLIVIGILGIVGLGYYLLKK